MSNVAKLKGYIKTSSELSAANNPLQSRVTIILTDFEPNLNKQGVPQSEKYNIMHSALNMPLKINFDGEDFYGHNGAIPLGPIVKVWEDEYNGREVIKGEAVIWTEHYKEVAEHIKALFDIGIGTSWEIYYADSSVDDSGVEWLNDCVFAGTCVVDTPAYGPERTRILAIAQKLGETMEENETQQEEIIAEEVIAADTPAPDNVEVAEEDTNVRDDITIAQDLLFKVWEGLDQLYASTYEIERQQTEANIGSIAENFSDMISKIATKIADMRASVASLSEENTNLKQAEAERLASIAKAELIDARRNTLANAGVIYSEERWAERKEVIYEMSETVFKFHVEDMSGLATRNGKSQAEVSNPVIPEPIGSTNVPDIAELGKVLRDSFKK